MKWKNKILFIQDNFIYSFSEKKIHKVMLSVRRLLVSEMVVIDICTIHICKMYYAVKVDTIASK